tara:strand:+ start:1202 stop:1477 length:276 start_codon:yes stop_codon:yes gene_type:complete
MKKKKTKVKLLIEGRMIAVKSDEEILTWKFKGLGLFKVVLHGKEIYSIRFIKMGFNDYTDCLKMNDGKNNLLFVEKVYQALGEMLNHLKKK